MPKLKVYNMSGKEAGTIDLSEKVFGAEYNEPLIHQAVVTRLANERQGTKSTLTRTEVRAAEESLGDRKVRVMPVRVQ